MMFKVGNGVENRQEIIDKKRQLENDRRFWVIVYSTSLAVLGAIFIVGATFASTAAMFFSGFLFLVFLWAFIDWNNSWKKEIQRLKQELVKQEEKRGRRIARHKSP